MRLLEEPLAKETGQMTLARFQEQFGILAHNIDQVMVTSARTVRQALLGLFCQGHVLLEDLPGVGKTLLAKTIAQSIAGCFSRIQFTPDLLPTDITGTSILDMRNNRFEFVPGPIFANIVLADELNRTGPRTQSALLEAMAEHQVTTDGTVRKLPRPFMVIATQNLVETYGTYPLPNSQLDRFLVSMEMGLPTAEQEVEILNRSEHGSTTIGPVLTVDEVVAMQELVLEEQAATPVKQYIVNILAATRTHPDLVVGASPRGGVHLLRAAQGWATFENRSYVVPEDIKEVARLVLSHRVVDNSSRATAKDAIGEVLDSVQVPL